MADNTPVIVRETQNRLPAALPTRSRGLQRQINRIESTTIVRGAGVQAEAMVTQLKAQELDHVVREAMTGQALLSQWATALAAGDPLVLDDLQFFTALARAGKGQLIMDLVDNFCREGRRF